MTLLYNYISVITDLSAPVRTHWIG